jgi:anti-anti-sigma factor
MQITTRERCGTLIIVCEGRLVCGDDCRRLAAVFMECAPLHAELDLGAVEAVDAAGLGTLVAILRLCRQRKCELAITAVSPRLRRTLAQVRLDRVLPLRLGEKDSGDPAARVALSA